MICLAMLLGIAKPTPALLPVRELIAVLMPITSPRRFTSGPPLLPGLMPHRFVESLRTQNGYAAIESADDASGYRLV